MPLIVFDKCHGDWTVYTKQVLSQVKKYPVNGFFPGIFQAAQIVTILWWWGFGEGGACGALGEYLTPTCSAPSSGCWVRIEMLQNVYSPESLQDTSQSSRRIMPQCLLGRRNVPVVLLSGQDLLTLSCVLHTFCPMLTNPYSHYSFLKALVIKSSVWFSRSYPPLKLLYPIDLILAGQCISSGGQIVIV